MPKVEKKDERKPYDEFAYGKYRPYGKDHFWNYLWYCHTHGLVSPGDYLELIGMTNTRSFLKLVTDLSDTRKAGRLRAIPLENGGMGYVPIKEGIFTNEYVR